MPGTDLVEVLIMDEIVSFAGEYVMKSERARDVLIRFVKGEEPSSLGDWNEI